MKKRHYALFLLVLLAFAFPLQSTKVNKADLDAGYILIGRVDEAEGFFGVNDRGDQLIFSRVRVKVERWIKGRDGNSIEFIVEGGSVGDLALKVSEYPEFSRGERYRLSLDKIGHAFKFREGEVIEEAGISGKPVKPTLQCCKIIAKWATYPVPYFVNPNCSDITGTGEQTDIKNGAREWVVSGQEILSFVNTTASTQIAYNGENDVFFDNSSSGSAIAATYMWYTRKGGQMLEFDMIFYEGAWDFYSGTAGCNGGFYVQTIAAHEFGHAVGLDHNRCTSSLMYPYADYCETNTATADDLACLAGLYQ
jgi:Matrixin